MPRFIIRRHLKKTMNLFWKCLAALFCLMFITGCAQSGMAKEDAEKLALDKTVKMIHDQIQGIIEDANEGYKPAICLKIPGDGCVKYLQEYAASYKYEVTRSSFNGEYWNVRIKVSNTLTNASRNLDIKVVSAEDITVPAIN
jgi:hypothetical protein